MLPALVGSVIHAADSTCLQLDSWALTHIMTSDFRAAYIAGLPPSPFILFHQMLLKRAAVCRRG